MDQPGQFFSRCGDRAGSVGEIGKRLRPSATCELPVASPWLNNIEPCWTHAKKAVMEAERKLTAAEITDRVCKHFGCELLPYLKTTAPRDSDEAADPPKR